MMEDKKELVLAVATHPGEHLLERMEHQNIGVMSIVNALDLDYEYVTAVLSGESDVDDILAQGLDNMGLGSKAFWLNLQRNYNEIARLQTGEYMRVSQLVRDARDDEQGRKHTRFIEVEGMMVQVTAKRFTKSDLKRMEAMLGEQPPVSEADIARAKELFGGEDV